MVLCIFSTIIQSSGALSPMHPVLNRYSDFCEAINPMQNGGMTFIGSFILRMLCLCLVFYIVALWIVRKKGAFIKVSLTAIMSKGLCCLVALPIVLFMILNERIYCRGLNFCYIYPNNNRFCHIHNIIIGCFVNRETKDNIVVQIWLK